MIELDAVIAGVIGVMLGASPAVIQAVWRYCMKLREERREQRKMEHEREMKELEVKAQAMLLGIEKNYDVVDAEAFGLHIRSKHESNRT